MFDRENDSLVMCKSSWHYRLVNYIFPYFFHWNNRVNLCPYMRRLVTCIFLFPFVAGWNTFMPERLREYTGICQALAIYVILVLSFSVCLDYWYVDVPWHVFAIAGIFGGFAIGAVFVGVVLGVMRVVDHIENRPRHYSEHKTIGIAKAYVGAKHDKICPSIKFCDAPEKDKNGKQVRHDKDCP